MAPSELAAKTVAGIEAIAASWSDDDRTVYKALFPLIAQGHPVRRPAIVDATGLAPQTVDAALARIEPMLERADDGIIGWSGLTQRRTMHRLDFGGRILHAWCALDTHFLPHLVGEKAIVTSSDPVTGSEIRFEAGPGASPATGIYATLARTDDPALGLDIIGKFCDLVFHFAQRAAAESFAADRDLAVVDVAKLQETARLLNQRVWGVA